MEVRLKPDILSLSGSMNHVIIQADSDVTLVLKYASTSTVIVQHTYTPNINGLVEVNLENIITPLLSFDLRNVENPYVQLSIVKQFIIEINEGSMSGTESSFTWTFSVIRAGIDHLADSATNFLTSNFLTWQPTVKPVTYYMPEFLTYYATKDGVVKCKAYVEKDGTVFEKVLVLSGLSANSAWTIPVQYAIIAGKVGDLPSYYDVWVEDTEGNRLTYIQRYYATDFRSEEEQWVMFENSLGGVDTFRAYGDMTHTAKHTHNIAEIEDESEEYRVDTEREFKKNTGHLSDAERKWLLDFFPSLGKYIYVDSYLRKIVVTDSDVSYQGKELPSNYTFTYKYADARPYLNIPRLETPPEMMDIKVPDVGTFTIAPRLVELQKLTLSGGALFPVQDPYSENWNATTLDAILGFIAKAASTVYKGDGSFGHTHTNISVLDALGSLGKYLLLNGEKIYAGLADEAKSLTSDSDLWNKFLRKDVADVDPEVVTFLKGIGIGDDVINSIVTSNGVFDPTDDKILTALATSRHFLSKTTNDVAKGAITFEQKTTHYKGTQFGEAFIPGQAGVGGLVDGTGAGEMRSLRLREFLEVPEYRFNRVSIQVGNNWRAPGGGIIENVEIDKDSDGNNLNSGIITLHLVDGDIGKVNDDDICQGVFHDGMDLGNNDSDDYDDSVGNFRFAGFFISYFRIKEIISSGNRNSVFRYVLRDDANWKALKHPCPMMHFVSYGNFTKPDRQSSRYSTLTYERYLEKVNTWEFSAANIACQFGDLSNLSVFGLELSGYSSYMNNSYITGHLSQLKSLLASIVNYTVDFSGYVDVITIDNVGNAIGGLYQLDADNQPYNYRINSAISVRKNGTLMTIAEGGDNAADGTYKIYAEPVGCTCEMVNSTIYITGISNIKDGVSGTGDDSTFNYPLMRSMDSCYVNLVIDCEGRTSIIKKFPVTIKHDSNPYVGADLSNEFSAVSWNTKTGDYIGLPITTDMQMWRNNEALDVTSVAVKDSTGKLLAKCPLAEGETITDVAGLTIEATLEINEGTGKKVGHVEITSMSKDADAVANYNITTTAVYAGISYERTLVHTVNKSTDTNVYRLVPSVGSVTGSRINGVMTLDNTSVSCQVYCDSSDDNHYQMTTEQMSAAGLTMKRVVNHKNGTTETQAYTIGDAVAITQDVSTVVFELNYNSAIYATETIPVLLEGVDGNGVEYVFLWKDDYDESADNKPSLYDESTSDAYQADGFLPYTDNAILIQWHDEPNGVGLNHPYEFYAQRKFVNGQWEAFGNVRLWSKYPKNSSPYILDLTNDNQTVPCDTEGNPISYQSSEFILFYGSEKISDFTEWDFSLVGNNVGHDTTLWDPQVEKYTIMPTGLSSASGTLVLTLTNKNNATIVLKATMSMAKASAGADAVVYSLVPEGSVIHRNMDGTYDATYYTVNVKMTSGTTTSLMTTIDELQAKGLELYIGEHAMTGMYFSLETEVGTKKSVVVTLKHGNSVVDQETIYVVSDGKKGTDASAYHLTSDIGTLTRDGDGAIKETLPTIGGYVKTGDGDDISVTSGYTIVAEEKNDEGITLDTHTSENGQFTIPSVNDGTTHIVINMYDASNPGVPICPSQDISVTKPIKGDRGFSGCLQRLNKIYIQYEDDGNTLHYYRNDSDLDGDGIHYIDYMVVKDDSLASGWRVYQCIDTHTASATFADDKAHWTEVGMNAVSAFFTYLIAKNASVELLSGSSFVIVENDIPVSGLSNGDIPLWIGALSADKTTAPFYVDKYGSMTANDANLTGLISEGMRQFNRNSFVPIYLSSIKSVSLDSYSDAYGVDSVSGSSVSVNGTVILPCAEGTALGYYKSDADGTVKEYPQSTPSYLKAGTHLSVRNGNGTGYNMWAMLGSQVNAWSNNSALYNLLNHCVLVCADPRVFSLDHQYELSPDGTYTRSDVAVKACGAYPTSTMYEYNHGCFSANGMRARFILLPPSQALQLISSIERFETYAGGVTGYDNALVWNVLNASDFSPMWCNVQEMLDETVKTGPTRMLTNNYSGDNFDIDAENGYDTYTDALLISKAIATNIGGLNPTLKNITFSIKLYSSPSDANSGNTPTWDVTVADA